MRIELSLLGLMSFYLSLELLKQSLVKWLFTILSSAQERDLIRLVKRYMIIDKYYKPGAGSPSSLFQKLFKKLSKVVIKDPLSLGKMAKKWFF